MKKLSLLVELGFAPKPSSGKLGSFDDRSDLGYGKTKAKYHKQRQQGSQYPYIDKDEHALDDISPEDDENEFLGIEDEAIRRFGLDVGTTDPGADASTQRDSFVDGNTRMSETALSSNQVFNSKNGVATGPQSARGITNNPSTRVATGSKQGWFSPPPAFAGDMDYEFKPRFDDVVADEDDSVKDSTHIIDTVHAQQEHVVKITHRQLQRLIREALDATTKRDTTASIEIDWAGDSKDIPKYVPNKLKHKIIEEDGPSGWPVVIITGPYDTLKDWYVNSYSAGGQESAREFDEWVVQ